MPPRRILDEVLSFFDPAEFARVRAALSTIAAVFGAIVATGVVTGTWPATVMVVLAAIVGTNAVATHATPIGNAGPKLGDPPPLYVPPTRPMATWSIDPARIEITHDNPRGGIDLSALSVGPLGGPPAPNAIQLEPDPPATIPDGLIPGPGPDFGGE